MSTELAQAIAALPLVDHHVHGALLDNPTREDFEFFLTESDRLGPAGTNTLDSQVGFALRRWCAPALDLPAHADIDTYFGRRLELGADEVNRRLLGHSGISHYLVETGHKGEVLHGPEGMRALTGARGDEVVRLEALAEELALEGVGADEFAERYAERLWGRTENAVGLKSIVGYRLGLDFSPDAPEKSEVRAAASSWLTEVAKSGNARIADERLLRHVIWAGVERRLPIQFHVGYGDPDLDLDRCDPLRMTSFLRLVRPLEVPIMLLHTYPFHRNAGYLAQVFPDVYLDVGLGVNFTGARSRAVIAESLELAPFSKILFSSDAWGLAELHYLGAHLWRAGMQAALQDFVDDDEWAEGEAIRVAGMIAHENAQRAYKLTKDA